MDERICQMHQGLLAALDNVQESYRLLHAGVFPDAEVCHDLLEQLTLAHAATQNWLALLARDRVH